MRTAKLKLTAVVLAATGLVALAGLGTALALAPKPAPLAPARDQPPGEAANAEDDPPAPDNKPKIDRRWQERPFPTVYPDIAAFDTKSLAKFEKKHLEPIYESDPPLRKLQKAKLSVAFQDFARTLRDIDRYMEDLPKREKERDWGSNLWESLQKVSPRAQEVAAAAFDLHSKPDDRRPWLVFRIAAEKRVEEAAKESKRFGWSDVPRLDAELALAKHDEKK
jgi:hypothetical protein